MPLSWNHQTSHKLYVKLHQFTLDMKALFKERESELSGVKSTEGFARRIRIALIDAEISSQNRQAALTEIATVAAAWSIHASNND